MPASAYLNGWTVLWRQGHHFLNLYNLPSRYSVLFRSMANQTELTSSSSSASNANPMPSPKRQRTDDRSGPSGGPSASLFCRLGGLLAEAVQECRRVEEKAACRDGVRRNKEVQAIVDKEVERVHGELQALGAQQTESLCSMLKEQELFSRRLERAEADAARWRVRYEGSQPGGRNFGPEAEKDDKILSLEVQLADACYERSCDRAELLNAQMDVNNASAQLNAAKKELARARKELADLKQGLPGSDQ